jgi:hypothetical protein
MDKEHEQGASELEATPALTNEPICESPASPLRPELQRRLDSIATYLAASLAKRNPLLATVGSVNSGLMSINLFLEESLLQALAAASSSIEQLQKLQPAIDMYLRVTRQIDRFAQLEIKGKSRSASPRDGGQGENRLNHVGNGS